MKLASLSECARCSSETYICESPSNTTI